MPYEVRMEGKAVGTFETSEEALDHVRAAVKERPDCEPEIIDTATGQAFEPAASTSWREHLANNVGY